LWQRLQSELPNRLDAPAPTTHPTTRTLATCDPKGEANVGGEKERPLARSWKVNANGSASEMQRPECV
jgi:hypothetical protein